MTKDQKWKCIRIWANPNHESEQKLYLKLKEIIIDYANNKTFITDHKLADRIIIDESEGASVGIGFKNISNEFENILKAEGFTIRDCFNESLKETRVLYQRSGS